MNHRPCPEISPGYVITRPETNGLPLKMDGWNTNPASLFEFPAYFLWGLSLALLNFGFRVTLS